tara:strand:- start:1397 stop:2395 length:999 start_codon:yes stop_codon:yes gene_type:complete
MEVLTRKDFSSLILDPNWADCDPRNNFIITVPFSELASLESVEFSRVNAWLKQQVVPVVGIGKPPAPHFLDSVDLYVLTEKEHSLIVGRIERNPIASATLVQVLRAVEGVTFPNALLLESTAYGTLQGGGEFRNWLSSRNQKTRETKLDPSISPVLLNRKDQILEVTLNNPSDRNSLSVYMRDALANAFSLVEIDLDIVEVHVSANGPSFCSGGNLPEFGEALDLGWAHHTRMLRMPAQFLARNAEKFTFYVHGACIGAGIEMAAFAKHLIAKSDSVFRLPEVGMGLLPGAGGCVSITNRIGRHRAAYMAISGESVDVDKALDWGLIDSIVD